MVCSQLVTWCQEFKESTSKEDWVFPFDSSLSTFMNEERSDLGNQQSSSEASNITTSGSSPSISAQAAQSRKVNNYKDLYGNLDNRLKKIFTPKSSQ